MKTLIMMLSLLFSTAALAVGLNEHYDPYFGSEQGEAFACETERNTLGLGDQHDPFTIARSETDSMDSMGTEMTMAETQVCKIDGRDTYNPYFG